MLRVALSRETLQGHLTNTKTLCYDAMWSRHNGTTKWVTVSGDHDHFVV